MTVASKVSLGSCHKMEKDSSDKGDDTPQEEVVVATDLSADGTANCYIVPKEGTYQFKADKGNSGSPAGGIASVEVLWEKTAASSEAGCLVKNPKWMNYTIIFEATAEKGNAVIAGKNASGTIVWSWHLWFTDEPKGQVYNNDAGTMMDRNLGATTVEDGGLFYQWGRKDPFCLEIGFKTVDSNKETGSIDYTIEHPTDFITHNEANGDWFYSGSIETDMSRWTKKKTMYDPCPAGYRVPDGDGGYDGVWFTAMRKDPYNESRGISNNGIDFSKTSYPLCSEYVFYPFTGSLNGATGEIKDKESAGYCWSVDHSPASVSRFMPSFGFMFSSGGYVNTSAAAYRSNGATVRCMKEKITKPQM